MDAEKAAGSKPAQEPGGQASAPSRWAKLWGKSGGESSKEKTPQGNQSSDEEDNTKSKVGKWSFGVLNDTETDEVPGSVLLMSKQFKRNEPLGLRQTPARTSASSLPSPYGPPPESSSRPSSRSGAPKPTTPGKSPGPPTRPTSARTPRPGLMRMFSHASHRSVEEKKKTADGKIILEPQPEDTLNDPLNWPAWRRDVALLSLGFYCAWGGGMTPVLAAAFNDVAATYDVTIQNVALTTGFYMCGLAIGSVIASPTAILIGKRPVYMIGALLYILSSIWCALSPNYASLVVARIFMGLAISPVECLPSATIAEIFYLHERAYRLGVYTLLLLGGKNLIPLISAVIANSLGWRWIFWFITIMGGLCLILLFFFVPETFWDRTPRAKSRVRKHHLGSLSHFFTNHHLHHHHHHHDKKTAAQSAGHLAEGTRVPPGAIDLAEDPNAGTIAQRRKKTLHHVGFADAPDDAESTHPATAPVTPAPVTPAQPGPSVSKDQDASETNVDETPAARAGTPGPSREASKDANAEVMSDSSTIAAADSEDKDKDKLKLETHNLPYHMSKESDSGVRDVEAAPPSHPHTPDGHESGTSTPNSSIPNDTYTQQLRYAPPKTYVDTLKPYHGRLRTDKWWKAAVRPFILFAYPSILWSTLMYSLSIGWLIVISEAIATIYRNKETYNFTALQCGLVYLSPFIGGVLGTAVAGKLSDVIVRWMSRRNDGVYEPEFRLVMGLPILISTSIGLMGFGWSAEERDNFMVPTVMFGILSFGCALGSTTAITFAVDSYRQYAGEALVTLNFSKNFLHGFIFSLFFPDWMEAKGPKSTFLVIGGIQIACVLTTIPMFIYGKRARMWTVRKNMMERF